MNLKAAIVISAALHVALMGYLHTVEVPEELQGVESTLRDFATVRMKTVRADEVAEDGSDAPAKGVPNPEPEPAPEPVSKPEPELESKPEPKPEVKPPPEPKPEPKVAPKSEKELKSVVTDKTQDSKSPVETDSEVDAAAKSSASTAPVDSGKGNGEGHAPPNRNASRGAKQTAQESGPRGIRNGSGEERKKLNQQYGLILFQQISKAKSYPRFARKANIEGRVLVAITIDRSGKILGVKVHKSSGYEILDENTVETIRNLKQFPPPPDALTWQTKTFVLPVKYKLS